MHMYNHKYGSMCLCIYKMNKVKVHTRAWFLCIDLYFTILLKRYINLNYLMLRWLKSALIYVSKLFELMYTSKDHKTKLLGSKNWDYHSLKVTKSSYYFLTSWLCDMQVIQNRKTYVLKRSSTCTLLKQWSIPSKEFISEVII